MEKRNNSIINRLIFAVFVLFLGWVVTTTSLALYVQDYKAKVKSLQEQVSEYHQAEVQDIYYCPEHYTVSRLLSIEQIAEFDKQYRTELDEDKNLGDYVIVDTKNVTEVLLEHRADDSDFPVIIERVFGIVNSDELGGAIIDSGNYRTSISYDGVKNVKKGDFVVTYILYEKNNDIEAVDSREDFVIDLS